MLPLNFQLDDLLDLVSYIAIENGILVVILKDGTPANTIWLKRYRNYICKLIHASIGVVPLWYEFTDFKRYRSKLVKEPKFEIVLNFNCINDGNSRPAFFNVIATKKNNYRSSKAGDYYSDEKFRITKRFEFYRFWERTGLIHPPSLSSYDEYMGNLKPIIFEASLSVKATVKIKPSTLKPCNVSYALIRQSTKRVRNRNLNVTELSPNIFTKLKTCATPENKGLETNKSRCEETPVKGYKEWMYKEYHPNKKVLITNDPEVQSIEEWVNAYDRFDPG